MRRRGLLAVVVVLAAIAATTPARADDADRKRAVDRGVAAAQDDLAESSQAVARAAAALRTAAREIPRAQQRLAQAQRNLAASRAAEVEASRDLLLAEEKVQREQARIAAVQESMERTRTTMNRIVRAVYTAGPFGDIEVILEAQDPGDLAERLQSVRTVVRGQQRTITALDVQRAQLEASRQRLETAQKAVAERRAAAREQRQRAQGFAAQAASASQRIRALVASRTSALAVANREKARTLAQLRALRAEQRRLAERLRGSGDGRGYPTGSLLWPAQGGLTQGVGPRIHPVYGYRSCHTGIDIGAASGSPIRAAAAGTVLEVTSGGPYGNRVVVQHSNGLATMYAHQSRVAVNPGDRLDRGEVLGYVGSTGFSTGPHLHFEVWIAGVPYNPMGWFGGDRSPVRC